MLCSGSFRKLLEIKLEGDYIKAAKICQNFNGTVFCVPYLKNGRFCLVIFNTKQKLDDANISMKLKYSYYIRPNDNLEFPMMDACFVDSKNIEGEQLIMSGVERKTQERIFINMFITKTFQMVSVIYDYKTGSILTKDTKIDITTTNGTHKNFPIGTFFDEKRYMVYVVYRQGETFMIDINKP